jgi:hypothetical protein
VCASDLRQLLDKVCGRAAALESACLRLLQSRRPR